jgi:DNA-directed RNA polymerase II subunit RPB1
MDGDYVLFNRQPSLHRMSMMGHQVRVLPHNTFRLNVSVTAPYNADFDGDEMNLHAPQSEEAAMELREIAAVPLQIVSPRDSKPIVSVVQDTLVGVNRFMRNNVLLNQREIMNMLIQTPGWTGKLPPPSNNEKGPKWSGKQVVSVLLPPLNLDMPNGQFDEDKDKGDPNSQNFVSIKNGIVERGVFDKSIFSAALIHLIYNDYGPAVTVDFLDSLHFLIANVSTALAGVEFLLLLFTGQADFVSIDDDHEITRINVRSEDWVIFTTDQIGGGHGDLAEDLILGIDDPPLAGHVLSFG